MLKASTLCGFFNRMSSLAGPRMMSQAGSLLVSTLSFIALVSVLIFMLWKSIFQNQKVLEEIKLSSARDLIVTAALRNARVATYYYRTIAENDPLNDMFIKCLIDDNLGNDCLSTGASYPMKLVDYDSASTSYMPVVGNPTRPAYYSYYAQICHALSADCPFEVTASFIPVCAGSATSCAAAANIKVTVRVKIHSSYESGSLSLAQVISTETVAIQDFQNNYFPVLPPTTGLGTPITAGAGVAGFITKYVSGTTTPGPGPGPGPSASPAPSAATSTVCGAGQIESGNCGTLTF